MNNIFTGIKVLDLTKVFSGPFATRMLADYGAQVIKIETEQNYDDSWNYPPLKNGGSGYFEILNRNKQSVSLHLKTAPDLEKFYLLCKEADVVVENLTPSSKFKLKVDYQTVQKLNPQLIYASLSGLGQKYNKKYYDVIAQAQSGLMSLTGTGGSPVKIGPAVVDAFSGMTLAFAISAALFDRQNSGQGQNIEVSMLGCAMNLLENNLIDYSISHQNPKALGNQDNAIAPFGIYKTKDGFIALACGNDDLWFELANFLLQKTSFDQSKFANNRLRLINQTELTDLIEVVFEEFQTLELTTELDKLEIPNSKVNQMSDVAVDQLNFEQGYLRQVKHSILGECIVPGTSIKFSNHPENFYFEAPTIGQDNENQQL